MNLSGKHVLVTGGSRGIGHAVAHALLEEGANVSVWSRSIPSEDEPLDNALRINYIACDVRYPKSIEAALAKTIDSHGPLTGCIANAGVRPKSMAQGDSVGGIEDPCYQTNVLGTVQTLQAVVASMISAGTSDGRLLAIGSLAGISGAPGHTAYAMSKAALSALIKSMAQEIAPHGITANLLVPGWVETSMNKDVIDNRLQYESIKRVRIPLRRWGQPDDLVGICIYLMSSLSRYHTGDTITIDGGYSLF